MLSMTPSSASPFSVSLYSTRGGISAKHALVMTPASSRRRKRSESVLGLIPPSERCNSLKRRQPDARSRTISGVQRSPINAAVRSIGQQALASCPIDVPAGEDLDGASRLANGRLASSCAGYDSTPPSRSKTTLELVLVVERPGSTVCRKG